MLELLTSVLGSFEGMEYLIQQTKTTAIESFYIKKQLEMNRAVETTNISLTVYKVFTEDGVTYRGSSTTKVHPGMTYEEIKNVVGEAFYAAGFVKNQLYGLAEKNSRPVKVHPVGTIAEHGLHGTLEKLVKAVYDRDAHEKGRLSYSEFFITKKDVTILNSNGVNESYTSYSASMETAAHWNDGKEIEIYQSHKTADCDCELLGSRIEKLFEVAEKKIAASTTPAVKDINVLLTGECLSEFFSYYYSNANAANVYTGLSTFKVGDELQGEMSGDKLTMMLDPYLAGSTDSRPFDSDGTPLDRVEIIKDGKLAQYWGNKRFCDYLGIEPTGAIQSIVVTGGSKTLAEMKSGAYLELVSFSDFQMNPITGDFASEIRLGFYHDGENTIPVTGSSVSGNIKDVHGSMFMSVERTKYNNYEGPATVCLRNVTIA